VSVSSGYRTGRKTEFCKSLTRKDDVLSALVFLGGRHQDTVFIGQLLDSGNCQRIQLLTKSSNAWIREAANAAITQSAK